MEYLTGNLLVEVSEQLRVKSQKLYYFELENHGCLHDHWRSLLQKKEEVELPQTIRSTSPTEGGEYSIGQMEKLFS